MKYTPVRGNKKTEAAVFVLLLCAALCLAFAAAGIGYRSMLQLCAVLFIVVIIMLSGRYLLCSHTYYVLTEGAEAEFCVVRRQGKRESSVCLLDLRYASEPVPADKNGGIPSAIMNKSGTGKTRPAVYNYCAGIFPDDAYFLPFETPGDGTVYIKIQSDTEFLGYLNRMINIDNDSFS